MMLDNDSVELIEENLTPSRTSAVCQSLLAASARIWGISIRNCMIGDG